MKFTLQTGWIAPNGQYYACFPWDHDRVIIEILEDKGVKNPTVRMGEKQEYIRVTGKPTAVFANADNPTQAQIDTMFEYAKQSQQ